MGSPRFPRLLHAACFLWCLTVAMQPDCACAADAPAAMDALRQKPTRELQALLMKQYEENRCLDVIDTAVVLSDKIQNKRFFAWAEAKSYEGRCYFKLTDGPIKPQVKQDLLAKALAALGAANAATSRLPQKTPIVYQQLINLTFMADVHRTIAESAEPDMNFRRADELLSLVENLVERRPDIARTALAGFISMKKGGALLGTAQRTDDRLKKSHLLKSALKEYRKALSFDYGKQKPHYDAWIHGNTGVVLESLGSLHRDEGYYRQAIASYESMLDVPGRSINFSADVRIRCHILVLSMKAALASMR
ncbi:MAG TPA: hypothetical protein VLH56_17615 [Dissulfurispiraceae bacterium]|nr:hypothetical protein [Dissulfurispiraceae bacterium]